VHCFSHSSPVLGRIPGATYTSSDVRAWWSRPRTRRATEEPCGRKSRPPTPGGLKAVSPISIETGAFRGRGCCGYLGRRGPCTRPTTIRLISGGPGPPRLACSFANAGRPCSTALVNCHSASAPVPIWCTNFYLKVHPKSNDTHTHTVGARAHTHTHKLSASGRHCKTLFRGCSEVVADEATTEFCAKVTRRTERLFFGGVARRRRVHGDSRYVIGAGWVGFSNRAPAVSLGLP
jgi:hypothetical protein